MRTQTTRPPALANFSTMVAPARQDRVSAKKAGALVKCKKAFCAQMKSSAENRRRTKRTGRGGIAARLRPAASNGRVRDRAATAAKDLRLAPDAAQSAGANTKLGADAERICSAYAGGGAAKPDFSGLIHFICRRSACRLVNQNLRRCVQLKIQRPVHRCK